MSIACHKHHKREKKQENKTQYKKTRSSQIKHFHNLFTFMKDCFEKLKLENTKAICIFRIKLLKNIQQAKVV